MELSVKLRKLKGEAMSRAKYQVLVIPYIVKDNMIKYAVFHRSDMPIWQFISGGGEDDEIPIQAAKREAYEEAGISFNNKYHQLETCCSIPTECFKVYRTMWGTECLVIPEYAFAVNVNTEEIKLSMENTNYQWMDYETAKQKLKYDSNKTALWEVDNKIKMGLLEGSFMIHLEKVTSEDAERIVEIKRLAYTDEDIRFGGGKGEKLKYIGNVGFIPWCMNRFHLYKIMLGETIIGTFWLDHETDERPNHFELQDFCITPEYQNKGYGREALKLMEKLHPSIKIWSLSTSTFSIRNQHLYEKMGYMKIRQTDEKVFYEKIV